MKSRLYDFRVRDHVVVHLQVGLNVNSSAHNCGCMVDGGNIIINFTVNNFTAYMGVHAYTHFTEVAIIILIGIPEIVTDFITLQNPRTIISHNNHFQCVLRTKLMNP